MPIARIKPPKRLACDRCKKRPASLLVSVGRQRLAICKACHRPGDVPRATVTR